MYLAVNNNGTVSFILNEGQLAYDCFVIDNLRVCRIDFLRKEIISNLFIRTVYQWCWKMKECMPIYFRTGLTVFGKISHNHLYFYLSIETSFKSRCEFEKELFVKTFKVEGPNLISMGPDCLVYTSAYIFTNSKESFAELIWPTFTAFLPSTILKLLRKPCSEAAAPEKFLKEEIHMYRAFLLGEFENIFGSVPEMN